MTHNLAELQDLAEALERDDFECKILSLGRLARVVVGQNPYCVLAILDAEGDDDLHKLISDAQAELTLLTLRDNTASIRWDLYVLVHVRSGGGEVPIDLIEAIESDTKYARKFVRVDIKRDAASIDRALRPFLPLRSATPLRSVDPIELMRSGLLEQNVDPGLADAALTSFVAFGAVVLT